MSREESYEQAAVNYRRAGYDLDAARCYRLAGAHRRAADIYQEAGEYAAAAASFADAGLPELGAWLLVQQAGQPAAARALLAQPVTAAGGADTGDARSRPSALRRSLVLASCEIAEGGTRDAIRPVIAEVCAALADTDTRFDQVTEEWAVALSEAAGRCDQAALVFAAAVRGDRYRAEQRWKAWSARLLDADIVLPRPTTTAV